MNKQEQAALLAAFQRLKKTERTFILSLTQRLAEKASKDYTPKPMVIVGGDV
jgi:hypothetical protein